MPTGRFRERRLTPERMDAPELDAGAHRQALDGLARLNAASLAGRAMWRAIRTLAEERRDGPLRVLDVACGGGDTARRLAIAARRGGRALVVHGLDISPTAVAYAAERTPVGLPVSYATANVLNDPLPTGYDVVISSLFLHHLEETEVVRLLTSMARAARSAVVVSDLRRSLAGYWLAHAACRMLSRSPIVHYDGPRSVEGAFTIDEMRGMAGTAGLDRATVVAQWPQRLTLSWRADQPERG